VNIADELFNTVTDELFSKVSALESELAKMQSSNGESLTLYTSYFTSYFPIIFDTIILVI